MTEEEVTPEELAEIERDEREGTLEAKRRLANFSLPIAREIQATRDAEFTGKFADHVKDMVSRNLPTKAAKIRYLHSKGLRVKEIKEVLGIRYQQVYQVVELLGGDNIPKGQKVCRSCGRLLTDPFHAAANIGPICAKKEGVFSPEPNGIAPKPDEEEEEEEE